MMVTRKPHILGKPFPRIEGELKVTGTAHYIGDLEVPADVLYAVFVSSSKPHALVKRIDRSAARAIPGVKDVFTRHDISQWMGTYLRDRPLLAQDRVRYVGEPIAVVVATDPATAREAAAAVQVTYQELPVIVDVMEGFSATADIIHPQVMSYARTQFVAPKPESNINNHCRAQKGDLETGWQNAVHIIEDTYQLGRSHHATLETHGAIALVAENGAATLWTSTQAPFALRGQVTQALTIAPEDLRVICSFVGGGFGGKRNASVEALLVAVADKVRGYAVKLILNRQEDLQSTFVRPGFAAHLKMGISANGYIVATEAEYLWDTGASGDAMAEVIRASAYAGMGPYCVPNVRIDSYGVYTNSPPATPMRGNGMSEIHWAIEQHIDQLADAAGLNPLALRLQNFVKGGDTLVDGRIMHATGLDQCLRQVAEEIDWASPASESRKAEVVRGKGIAAMWNPVVISPGETTRAFVHLNHEHICAIGLGSIDMGQGVYTLVTQLVSAELGVPADWVRLLPVDTGQSDPSTPAPARQSTWSTGNAVIRAAHHAKEQVLTYIASLWDEPIGNLDIIDGIITSYATERNLSLPELLRSDDAHDSLSPPQAFLGIGEFVSPIPAASRNACESELPVMHFGTGAVAVEVEVDVETGEVGINKVAAAFDVGRAINPDIVRAQIKGGVMQGISRTLLEHLEFDQGVPHSKNLHDYRIATIRDLPRVLEPITVEVPQDDGPFGARGVGEHTMASVSPAIANAIFRAANVRIRELPLCSERVWSAMQKLVVDGS